LNKIEYDANFWTLVHVQQSLVFSAHHKNKASIPAIKNSYILKTAESKATNIKKIKTTLHTIIELGCTTSPSYNRSFLIP
jgi:hypothetical protein